jgi:hypothetical protein
LFEDEQEIRLLLSNNVREMAIFRLTSRVHVGMGRLVIEPRGERTEEEEITEEEGAY